MLCFICAKNCFSFRLMTQHVRRNHILLGITNFPCNIDDCTRIYSSLKSLYQHIRNDHLSREHVRDSLPSVSFCSNTDLLEIAEPVQIESRDESSSSEEEADDIYDRNDLLFMLKIFSQTDINRACADRIFEATIDWYKFKSKNPEAEIFKFMETEYKRIKLLKSLGLWLDHKSLVMNYEQVVCSRNGLQILENSPVTTEVIPLKDIFYKILQIKNIRSLIHSYMSKKNNDGEFKDVKDERVHREHVSSTHLPFVIFYDELETGNPLGSHRGKNKLGMLYVALRCFPPEMYSSLNNIYLYGAIPSNVSDLDPLISHIADEIIYMKQNGIKIQDKTYFFRFVGIADNLGKRQFLGFIESFSVNYSCRFCRAQEYVPIND